MNAFSVNTYLHYGYLAQREASPQCPQVLYSMDGIPEGRRQQGVNQLIEQGGKVIEEVFARLVEDNPGDYVVPISGGLDTRVILGELVNQGVKDRVQTVTFGTPGTYDYDIGKQVAKSLKLRHHAIDLTQIPISTQALVNTIQKKNAHWTDTLEAHYNGLIYERFGPDPVYCSGFLGGVASGAHLDEGSDDSWETASTRFAAKQKRYSQPELTSPSYDPTQALPAQPLLSNDTLSYYEQIDFAVRQPCFVYPIISSPAHRCVFPYADPAFIRFMLSLGDKQRRDRALFKAILSHRYPKLASLPTKENRGLPLAPTKWDYRRQKLKRRQDRWLARLGWKPSNTARLMTNYVELDRAIRDRSDFQAVFKENISDLKRRDIIDWLDVEAILNDHLAEAGSYGQALSTLVSLELNLKAGSPIPCGEAP